MTAHIQRMFGNGIADRLDRPNLRRIGPFPLSAFELQLAKQLWMRQLQTQAFAEEIKSLETTGKVNKNSVIAAFHPYLDEEDGLIKLRSRIRLSLCLQATVDLPLLPGRNEDNNKVPHFITLLVREAHRRVMHAGLRDTLSELRQEAWILRGRQIVKGILAKCACCNRMNSRPYDQPTAPLPMDRCTSAPPFDVTGVDFAGPLYIRGSKKKSWICLFTCGVVRAVHLELVMSLTARCFLMAIERFVSRFGVCRVIYSDNAKTFKRADKDLATLWKKAEPEILQEIAHKGIQWKFIAEGAPWWGGFWERMVGTVKRSLIKATGRAELEEDELRTILCRVEAAVNSRPITFVYNEHNEEQPFCPSHFFAGRRLTVFQVSQRKKTPPT